LYGDRRLAGRRPLRIGAEPPAASRPL